MLDIFRSDWYSVTVQSKIYWLSSSQGKRQDALMFDSPIVTEIRLFNRGLACCKCCWYMSSFKRFVDYLCNNWQKCKHDFNNHVGIGSSSQNLVCELSITSLIPIIYIQLLCIRSSYLWLITAHVFESCKVSSSTWRDDAKINARLDDDPNTSTMFTSRPRNMLNFITRW